jgi:RNA-dependent RNA polymerase
MEIFVSNIAYNTAELQLTRALEPILHQRKFQALSGGAPMNFIVRIRKIRDQSGYKSSGQGTLLVPSRKIGLKLLELVKTAEFNVRNRRIFMRASPHNVGPDDLMVLKEPYQDPQIRETQERRRAKLSGSMSIAWVEFGWECHDGKVSIEWSSRLGNDWTIEFNPDTHNWALHSNYGLRILIALRSIQASGFNADSKSCILFLERPPIFERNKESTGGKYRGKKDPMKEVIGHLESANLASDNSATRDRLVTPDNRGRVFAYLRVVRIKFGLIPPLIQFKAIAKEVGVSLKSLKIELVDRKLFAPLVFEKFGRWIQSLPFEVAFQIEGLLSRASFCPTELLDLKDQIASALKTYPHPIVCASIQILEQKREERTGASATVLFKDIIKSLAEYELDELSSRLTPDLFQCHHVMVTPTRIVLHGPFPDETNRVIRKYGDYPSNFIRVEFREEDRLQFRWDREVDGAMFINERVGRILKEGIIVAGRKFEFLAYSFSALREHAVWFVTPFQTQEGETITAESIRQGLGDFSRVIECPARYGARLSQAFSATEPSVYADIGEVILGRDKISPSGSAFTDGVGLISPPFAEEIWEKFTAGRSKQNRRRLQTPSVFQIRMGGYKGVLCVDNRLDERTICTRDSMDKFKSDDYMVEIARAFDRPMLMYLNRPLIMLLETLGVPLTPFMELQQKAITDTKEALKSLESAARLLEQYGLGTAYHMTSVLLNMQRIGANLIYTDQELPLMPFLGRLLKFSVHHIFRDLKYRSRIPVEKAWTLVGVADEYDYLNEGEIFGKYVAISFVLLTNIEKLVSVQLMVKRTI